MDGCVIVEIPYLLFYFLFAFLFSVCFESVVARTEREEDKGYLLHIHYCSFILNSLFLLLSDDINS